MKKIALVIAAAIAASVFGFSGCKKDREALDVYMPDGAPALALGLPMYEDGQEDGVEYHVVAATTVQTYVTGKEPKAEVCVLPINLAAKLLGEGDVYKLAGLVTHGNMYFLSSNGVVYNQQNFSALLGKTVGVVQLDNVPGLTLKAALNRLGIAYNDLSNGASPREDAINLRAANPAALSGGDLYMLPSPEADWRAANTDFNLAGSLQELYGGEDGYPQAAIVVKNSVLEEHSAWVQELLSKIERTPEWLQTAEKAVIANAVQAHLDEGLTPKFTADTLTDTAIAHSGIALQRMDGGAVAAVESFLREIVQIDASKAAIPSQGFYWM